jgi:predicted transcriptional regulator
VSSIYLRRQYVTLDQVYEELQAIKALLQTHRTVLGLTSTDRDILLKLNGSQIKTYLLLQPDRTYSAQDVAALSHNSRAYESNILNQLVRLNLVTKHRKGRQVYFTKCPIDFPNEEQ